MRPNTPHPNIAFDLSPEFRFVLDVCRATGPSLGDGHNDLKQLDWDEVLRIAEMQGVLPLIAHELLHHKIDVPAPVGQTLRQSNERYAIRNLYLSDRLIEVVTALEKSGITAVPFKGPALAARLYGNLGLRQSCDVDLLVRQHDFPLVFETLGNLRLHPSCELTSRRYELMLKRECELSFAGADEFYLDLHWNVMARYFSVPITIEAFWERLLTRRLGGAIIRELAPEDLLLCLVLHARRHYWARLIWICDIAHLIAQTPDLDWTATLERAQRLHVQRILLLTFYLCHNLFGTVLPNDVLVRVQDDKQVESLAMWCVRNLQAGLRSADSGLRNYFVSLTTRERWRDRIRQVLLHSFTPGTAEWDCAQSQWTDIPRHLARMGTKALRFALSNL